MFVCKTKTKKEVPPTQLLIISLPESFTTNSPSEDCPRPSYILCENQRYTSIQSWLSEHILQINLTRFITHMIKAIGSVLRVSNL